MLYSSQIEAGAKIIDTFKDSSYALLLAEMQSGKTGTFIFTWCEMFRQGLVDNCVIFSGNREIELKDQSNQFVIYRDAYTAYLWRLGIDFELAQHMAETMLPGHVDPVEDKLRDKSNDKITVVWGPDLKKYVSTGRTLYIWDE